MEQSQQREALQVRVEELEDQLSVQSAEQRQQYEDVDGIYGQQLTSLEDVKSATNSSSGTGLAHTLQSEPSAEVTLDQSEMALDCKVGNEFVDLLSEHNRLKRLNHDTRVALKCVFPYSLYFKSFKEAEGLSPDEILDHFVSHGMSQGFLLPKNLTYNAFPLSRFDPFAGFIVFVYRYFPSIFGICDGNSLLPQSSWPNEKMALKRVLSNTLGSRDELVLNDQHSFSKSFSLLHYKSGAVCTYIPKNACTNLRYSIALANGFIGGLGEIDWIHSNNNTMAPPSSKEILSASTTFVFLRSPFSRLVSYFMDKIVGSKTQSGDCSYEQAQKAFAFIEESQFTFKGFVRALWDDPGLLKADIHLRQQVDFLLYRDYDHWFSVEDVESATKILNEEIGLEIIDTRFVTSHTSYGFEMLSDGYYGDLGLWHLMDLKDSGFMPYVDSMLDPETCYHICCLYLADIILYSRMAKTGNHVKAYLDKAFEFSASMA